MINAIIEADRLRLERGETQAISMPTDSGRAHLIHRCPRCKIALWSTYGGREQVRFVRVSTLDDAHRIELDVHIFTRSKVPWVRLPEGARARSKSITMSQRSGQLRALPGGAQS